MELADIVHSDPEILGGTPVFAGTRVPVQTLLVYLESSESLDDFLDNFPTVSKAHAVAFLEEGARALLAQIEIASVGDIDRELIEDATNPDAWDPPLTVTPIRS